MGQEINYNIPIYSYFYPIELYGRIFKIIIKELWYYSIIILVPLVFLESKSSSPTYLSCLISFFVYAFIAYFMIAWHEFGHAAMSIYENSGIVNIDLRVNKNGLFRMPSIVSHGYDTTNQQNRMVVLGGIVATGFYNPLINVAIYGLLTFLIPKENLPNLLFFICVPLLLLVDFLFSNTSSDLYKLSKIYSSGVFENNKYALIKDIVKVAKNIAHYCLILTKQQNQDLFANLIPVKKSNCGIWLGDQLIISSYTNEHINDLKSVCIEKAEINIWFSINDKRSLKYIIGRFGFNSIHVLIKFKEENLICIKKSAA